MLLRDKLLFFLICHMINFVEGSQRKTIICAFRGNYDIILVIIYKIENEMARNLMTRVRKRREK